MRTCLPCLCLALLFTMPPLAADDVWVGIWNVENLFDAIDDPGGDDNWLPDSWDEAAYAAKLANLARLVCLMNDGKGPDILALIEVEKRGVVADLVGKLPHPEGYRIAHVDGEAGRGIEVALISRFPIATVRSHYVAPSIRDILEVRLNVRGHALTVLVNHWKSRYGGALDTATRRAICAARCYQLYYEIVRREPDADVLVMGDLNDTPDNVSVQEVLHAHASMLKIQRQTKRRYLYNATCELPADRGTYFYDYGWSYIDQIILSRGLLDDVGLSYVPGSIAIFDPGNMLLAADGTVRDFDAKKDPGGYSDHLPLVARLRCHEAALPRGDLANPESFAATAWMQTAGEYAACTIQAYNAATRALDRRLAELPRDKTGAVVLDLDETVLDNTPYNAAGTLTGLTYPNHWLDWVNSAQARAVPGAADFLHHADAEGVAIYYVSNRKPPELAGTVQNLQALGLPQATADHVLLRTAEPSKTARRNAVLANHELLLLVGDNLNDFTDAFANQSATDRVRLVESMAGAWGDRFIILPNPIYGDWENALFDHDRTLTPAARRARAIQQLRVFQPPASR